MSQLPPSTPGNAPKTENRIFIELMYQGLKLIVTGMETQLGCGRHVGGYPGPRRGLRP